MTSGFETEIRVRSYELDSLGHVNHAVYLNYLEQARYDALTAGGLPPAVIRERGWGVYVVRVEIDYHRECFHEQLLRVTTVVEEFRKASMIIRQQIRRVDDGPGAEPAVTARIVLVWVGEGGRPMRVPDEARAALAPGSTPDADQKLTR